MGAFISYSISKYFLADLFNSWAYLANKKEQVKQIISKYQRDLVFYLIFLRLFPGSPNWAMNLSFPHLGITNFQFIITVFIGIAPWNFFSCSSGNIISSLANTNEIMGKEQYIQVRFKDLI